MDLAKLHECFKASSGVITDSRKLEQNCLFIALKGVNFDGNEFAEMAIEKGAKFAVVDRPEIAEKNDKMILVEDTLKSLQQLANYHRKQIPAKIIALTGSNGKTTTKELIHSVLSQKYVTRATVGNLNNHIGVPLTLLEFDEKTEIGVVEMGANHIGEIDFLSRIAAPDFGLITNYGYAHLEGFGSFEGVIKGKSELYDYLLEKPGMVFLNIDDPIQKKWTNSLSAFTFGEDNQADCNVNYIREKSGPLTIGFEKEKIQSQLYGDYNFTNLATAIAIGKYFELNQEEIKKGIASYLPANNRSQIISKSTNRITLDAYNANPTSMRASISSFCPTKQRKSIVIIGDMFELGAYASAAHQEVIDQLIHSAVEKVITVGDHFYQTQTEGQKFKKFRTLEETKKYIAQNRFDQTDILIKGSRGMALEGLLDFL
tara:strand:+ start:67 stop:1353 length:1287 start_codon:yes stop_codon:yes gene_type:complete